jgi:hypothetical protein
MVKARLFVKGEIIYALLSSYSHPNILIPVKAIVKDVKYDEINPVYLIKVVKFYDNILFLKKYLFDMTFANKIGRRPRRLKIEYSKIKNLRELEKLFNGDKEESMHLVVDSIMCKKHKGDMVDLFNKIQNHLIEKNFRQCREYMTRIFYSGQYRLSGDAEYHARLNKLIGDKIEMNFDKFTRLL